MEKAMVISVNPGVKTLGELNMSVFKLSNLSQSIAPTPERKVPCGAVGRFINKILRKLHLVSPSNVSKNPQEISYRAFTVIDRRRFQ